MEKKTLALVSLGCAKNAVDLQNRASHLLAKGWTLSPDHDRADVVIVNTCSFIASAREEAEEEITRALELKARGQYGHVVVTGCYPQRYPEAKAAFPGVDSWEGVPQGWLEPHPKARLRLSGKAFGYLKIAEGCAHRCAYCAIPLIRGAYRSRPQRAILAEARALLASGCRELNIIAQDPMLYGIDFPAHKPCLVKLLKALDRLPGDFWIRVLYSYPHEITDDFIDWLKTSPHATRYVDVPLQHTVPEVLRKMNRGAAVAASATIADRLRREIPGITLRTTIMTGFPSETEARFNQMRADLKRLDFDRLGAFAFSPEEGTTAVKMGGRPSRATAEAREKLIMADAKRRWKVRAKAMLGEVYPALVVAPGVARMKSQAPDVDGVVWLVESEANPGFVPEVGSFVNVRLVGVEGFDFEGECV